MVKSAKTTGNIAIGIQLFRKVYDTGKVKVEALKGINLEIEKGEMVAIVGPSGSGKSTLMNLVGCLDTPTSGIYEIGGQAVAGVTRDELADIRNRRVGFVFQAPAARCSASPSPAPWPWNPTSSSPTSPPATLDSSAGGDIMSIFTDLWQQGRTIVIITHDPALSRRASRVVEIHDGRITSDQARNAAA